MTPLAFHDLILEPAAEALDLGTGASLIPDNAAARCVLLAIAGQESAWTDRLQIPVAYSRGFWQCQESGGVAGAVQAFPKTISAVCALYSIGNDVATIFEAIAYHDPLAYAVARMILLADPLPLPAVGDAAGAWACYQRNWRPGAPSPTRWATVYPQAVSIINGAPIS